MIKGSTYQNTNVRNQPVVSSTSYVKSVGTGTAFEGVMVKGGDGRDWIEMSKLGGVDVSNLFVASWVVNWEVVNDPIPTTPTFPDSFTLTDPAGNKAEYQFVRVIE